MASVTLKAVTKQFDNEVLAVDNLNLAINDREFVVLVGASGCGKSTTLRMIAGLEKVTRGEILISDRVVNDVPPKDRDIAMVFQNYALYPHMTVFDNLAFGLKLRKFKKPEIKQRVENAAALLGITELVDRKPKALSGGERQRVAVGRALVRNPKVFLFDEPLSNLDAKLRLHMRTEIAKLHQRLQTTMVYVTHDQVEAMTLGQRIVVMKNGKISQVDTPLNLYNRPANVFVAGFIGSPAMNFLQGKIIHHGGLWFEAGSFKIAIPPALAAKLGNCVDKNLTLGIRPEDISDNFTEPRNAEQCHLHVQVDLVEPMGNAFYVYGKTGMHAIIARLAADSTPALGPMKLSFPLAKAHFFDTVTELAIY